MIDVLKPLWAMAADSGWRAPFNAATSVMSMALAPLFVISSRVLTEISDITYQPVPARAAAARAPAHAPQPAGAHWQRIVHAIEDSLCKARKAAELQSAALIQADAADFTLAKIIEDLTAVMPRAAELRILPSRSALVPQRALAA